MIKRLASYPKAALQAAAVKKTALVLPEPAGDRGGQIGAGPALRLLVLGDSSAAGVSQQEDALAGQLAAQLALSHQVTWQLLAQSGGATSWAVQALDAHTPLRADVAVVALGLNDVKNGVPLSLWKRRMARIMALLTEKHGIGLVVWSQLPPMGRFPLLPDPLRGLLGRRSDRFDAELARLMEGHPKGCYLPLDLDLDGSHMAPDGFHPGPLIYAQWAQAAAQRIRAKWAGPGA